MGEIHLDPATSPEFNQLVQALLIYTEQDNGLSLAWGGHVFLNPPGGLVTAFWNKLCDEYRSGNIQKAFWVGFSVEQLCTLADELDHPADFDMCILRKRLIFNREDLSPGESPSHGNYIAAIGCDPREFERLFSSLGKVTHGRFSLIPGST